MRRGSVIRRNGWAEFLVIVRNRAEKVGAICALGVIQRRDVDPGDVQVDVLYCGVCHSDLHQVPNEIELIKIQQINEAYNRLLKSDVKYRFVIDMDSLKTAAIV